MKNKEKLQNKLKDSTGSVTLFVLITMMFFLLVTLTWYTHVKNQLSENRKQIKIIQKQYNSSNMEEEYRKFF